MRGDSQKVQRTSKNKQRESRTSRDAKPGTTKSEGRELPTEETSVIQESADAFIEELKMVKVEKECEDTDNTQTELFGPNKGIQESVEMFKEELHIVDIVKVENEFEDTDSTLRNFLGDNKGVQETVETLNENLKIMKVENKRVDQELTANWTRRLRKRKGNEEPENRDIESLLVGKDAAIRTPVEKQRREVDSTDCMDGVKRAAGPCKRELQCRLCCMTFVRPLNLANHMNKMHNFNKKSKQAALDLKTDQEAREKAEDQHIAMLVNEETQETTSTKEPKEHYCSLCGACFAKRQSLLNHTKRGKCADNQYTCEQCQKVFVSLQKLRAHMLTHLEQFPCDLCDRAFSVASELSKHKADKHVRIKHQCTECKKVLPSTSTLRDHMRTHNGEKPFVCSLCGKSFSQKCNLQQHLMRHNQIKPFECNFCIKTFVSKGELFSHVRTHIGDRPFACNICKLSFTQSSYLVQHKRTHTGERPYACEYCPMRFALLSTLKIHRRTHTGERPYACEYCPMRFTALSTLKKHRRTHTGDRSLKCKFCQRDWDQKCDCFVNERTHTGDRRYSCQLCGSAFQQLRTLRTHMKTHTKAKAAEAAGREVEQDEQPQRTICLSKKEDVDQKHEPLQVAENDNNSIEE